MGGGWWVGAEVGKVVVEGRRHQPPLPCLLQHEGVWVICCLGKKVNNKAFTNDMALVSASSIPMQSFLNMTSQAVFCRWGGKEVNTDKMVLTGGHLGQGADPPGIRDLCYHSSSLLTLEYTAVFPFLGSHLALSCCLREDKHKIFF